MKIPYKIFNEEKHYTFPSGVAKLTATTTEVSEKEIEKTSDKLDINSQIEEFFSRGNKIKKINSDARSIPEYDWYKESYPKNKKHMNIITIKPIKLTS